MTFVLLIVAKMILVQSKQMKNIIILMSNEEEKICTQGVQILQNIYAFHVNYCRKMIFWIVIFLYAAGFVNMEKGFYQLYEWKKTVSVNVTLEKPQAVPFWFPFDKEKHYSLAMSYQVCHIIQTLLINGSIQALMNSVMVFVRAHLIMLQYETEHFDSFSSTNKNVSEKDFPEKNLRQLAIKHQEIIRWVKEFNACFKTIFLLEYCITSLQLATTLIQIIQGVKLLFNLTFITHCFLQLLALAWNANEILLESSAGLAYALFKSPWYRHNKYCQVLIRVMIMRCGKPVTMSIGPLGAMSIDMALSRVKLSYTCLSLLQAKTTS